MIEFLDNIPFGVWVLVVALASITAAIAVMFRDDAAE